MNYKKFAAAATTVLMFSAVSAGFGSTAKQSDATLGETYAGNIMTETIPETTTTVTSETVTTTTTAATTKVTTTTQTTTQPAPPPVVSVNDAQIEALSVSELKITWDAEADRTYSVEWTTEAPYAENITFLLSENGIAYLTGLRADSEYQVVITPVMKEGEEAEAVPVTLAGRTQSVEVIQDFDREEGWTNCFAGERASGLTAMPSSGAIYGSSVDTVTGTGVRRFENGDYCCAMGVWYGYCNDRFLVELDNGIQFTTRICDSKGYASDGEGRYHNFGDGGKCIIEFIYDDYNLPSCVAFSGSWGYYNWNGLDLGANIKSIQKINY